jgi:hypothetical protein
MTQEIDPENLKNLANNFLVSNEPEYLARYIEEDGKLSDAMRGFLAKLIRDHAPKRQGNAKPLRDNSFYHKVEAWCSSQENAPIYNYIAENELTLQETLKAFEQTPKNIRPTLQSAYRHFANQLNIDESTLQKQYERGRKNEQNRE